MSRNVAAVDETKYRSAVVVAMAVASAVAFRLPMRVLMLTRASGTGATSH